MANFCNLTNGLLAIDLYKLTDYRYIRIQSTWCEQKHWGDILWTLSDDFLMAAAKGEICYVFDFSEKRKSTRAVWQGLEWIKFVLFKRWYGITYVPEGRAKTAGKYFEEQYKKLPKKVKNRIDYYGKFCGYGHHIFLYGITDNLRKVQGELQYG
jgi:hypothetical protein